MSSFQDVRTSGAVLSTNAQIKVESGFKPAMVYLLNSANVTEAHWLAGMPSDSMVRRSGNANPSYVTSSGVQLYKDTTGEGFTIEPDSQLNPTGSDEIFWVAFRGSGPTTS